LWHTTTLSVVFHAVLRLMMLCLLLLPRACCCFVCWFVLFCDQQDLYFVTQWALSFLHAVRWRPVMAVMRGLTVMAAFAAG
jgi:hypothetical protein